jgi:hypothetical protein
VWSSHLKSWTTIFCLSEFGPLLKNLIIQQCFRYKTDCAPHMLCDHLVIWSNEHHFPSQRLVRNLLHIKFTKRHLTSNRVAHQVHWETAHKQQSCNLQLSSISGFLLFEKQKTMWETREKNLSSHPRIEKSSYSQLWQPKQCWIAQRKTFQMSERKEHTFPPFHQETARNKILVRGRIETHNSKFLHR